jgi:hypothetical protein
MRRAVHPTPAVASLAGDAARPDEYLTVAEVAARLKLSAKTVRNRMYDGTWQRGEQWFAPNGIGPRFKWSAIVAWLEAGDVATDTSAGLAYGDDIPLPCRGRPRRVDAAPRAAVGDPRA